MKTLQFAAGDILWKEGEAGDGALLLNSGTVVLLDGHTAQPAVIATYGPGDVLGEVALIDEYPRTHVAQARTAGQAQLLGRDEFQHALLSSPQTCLPFFLALFERLRQLEPRPPAVLSVAGEPVRPQSGWRLCLWPLSRHTAGLLPDEGLLIHRFPFRVGRAEEAREKTPPSLNDLWLLDNAPFMVSRNHLTFLVLDGSRHVVRDCGSHLGTLVNEQRIGGQSPAMEAELNEGDNVIILGPASSPFKFRAVLERLHA
jgi:CRP-like cAMP-binding protein